MLIAKRLLHRSLTLDAAAWAIRQLEQGQDSTHLRQLAGISGQENAFKIEALLDCVLRELGIQIPTAENATKLYAKELAEALRNGSLTGREVLSELYQLQDKVRDKIPQLFPFHLLAWAVDDIERCGETFEYDGLSKTNLDEVLLKEIETFLSHSK